MDVHHALLYVGFSRSQIETELTQLRGSYAVTFYEYEEWGINQSRALIEDAYRTDSAGETRALVLIAGIMTVEAQNALLKLLEEPPTGSVFFVFIPNDGFLLPTLNSRLMRMGAANSTATADHTFIITWLAQPIADQLAEIESVAKKKNTGWMVVFKQAALQYLRHIHAQVPNEVTAHLYATLSLVGTRGASNKMLLEEIVLLFSSHRKAR